MVDTPPTSPAKAAPTDWNAFVVPAVASPQTAAGSGSSGVRANEDKPPLPDNKQDVLELETAADMAANRGLREKFAEKAYDMGTGCLCAWFIMLFCSGIINALLGKEMWSDKVIIAVTTGVTVSVLAAFLGVIRGLFPGSSPKKSGKQPEARE